MSTFRVAAIVFGTLFLTTVPTVHAYLEEYDVPGVVYKFKQTCSEVLEIYHPYGTCCSLQDVTVDGTSVPECRLSMGGASECAMTVPDTSCQDDPWCYIISMNAPGTDCPASDYKVPSDRSYYGDYTLFAVSSSPNMWTPVYPSPAPSPVLNGPPTDNEYVKIDYDKSPAGSEPSPSPSAPIVISTDPVETSDEEFLPPPVAEETSSDPIKPEPKIMTMASNGENTETTPAPTPLRMESNYVPLKSMDLPYGSGGGFGDPHLLTWRGKRYDYQGACDLVLVHSDQFADGAGLDIHIRTSIRHDWSFIENAAVRIGTDILEMESKGVYYLNGEPFPDMHATIHGFPIHYKVTDGGRSELIVALGGRAQIKLREYHDFVSVKINEAQSKEFSDAVGLMGSFELGSMLARDGKIIVTDPNAFAQEWQVRATEPKLFHVTKGPQYPQECQLPEPVTQEERKRRLQSAVSYNDAVKVCAEWDESEREGCIYDVMATGDLSMGYADAY